MGKKKNANRVSVAVTEKVTRLMKIENGKKKMVWAVNDGEGVGYREVAPPCLGTQKEVGSQEKREIVEEKTFEEDE